METINSVKDTVSHVSDLVVIISAVMGLVTAAFSSIITLIGGWLMIKVQIKRHEEKISELRSILINEKGTGLTQQVQMLREEKVDKKTFDDVLFNAPGAIKPALAHMSTRLARVETVCRERHSQHAAGLGAPQTAKETGG